MMADIKPTQFKPGDKVVFAEGVGPTEDPMPMTVEAIEPGRWTTKIVVRTMNGRRRKFFSHALRRYA